MARPSLQSALSILAIACVLGSTASHAQPGNETVSGIARAEIVTPISIISIADLDFGGMAIAGVGNGTLTVSPHGGAAAYTGLTHIACANGPCPPHPALFVVNGAERRSYRLTLPDHATALAIDGSGLALEVSDLRSASRNLPGIDRAGMLNAEGEDELRVGGILSVPASTPPGRYVAQLIVVVRYD